VKEARDEVNGFFSVVEAFVECTSGLKQWIPKFETTTTSGFKKQWSMHYSQQLVCTIYLLIVMHYKP
jgi:hypothetical protein